MKINYFTIIHYDIISANDLFTAALQMAAKRSWIWKEKKNCQKDEFLCESNTLSVQNVWFWDDQANNFKQEIRIPKGQRSFIHLTLNTWWILCNDMIQIYHPRVVFHWNITSVFQASHQRHGEWEEQGKNLKNSKEIKS